MTVSALSLGRLSSSPDHGPKPPPQSSLCARLEWLSISESQRKCWQRSNRSTDSLWPSVWGHHTDSIHRNETRWPFTLSCFFFERTFTGGYINTQTPKSSCYATEDPQTWTLLHVLRFLGQCTPLVLLSTSTPAAAGPPVCAFAAE